MRVDEFVNQVWLPYLREKNSSWKTDVSIWRIHVQPFWGARQLGELKSCVFADWLAILQAKQLAMSTRNRILSTLRGIFKYACHKGVLDEADSPHLLASNGKVPPKDYMKVDKVKVVAIWERLLASERKEAAAILLMLLTGARKGEILKARWEDVRMNGNDASLRLPGNEKYIRFSPQAWAILNGIARTAGSSWIFPGRDINRPLSDIFNYWNGLRVEFGVGKLKLDDLRKNLAQMKF